MDPRIERCNIHVPPNDEGPDFVGRQSDKERTTCFEESLCSVFKDNLRDIVGGVIREDEGDHAGHLGSR